MSGAPAPPFQFVGGSLALDFANTVGNWGDPATRRDYFRTPADLLTWTRLAAIPGPAFSAADVPGDALRRVVALRTALYRLFAAAAAGTVAAAEDVRVLEQAVRRARQQQALAADRHGLTWAWTPSASRFDQLLAAIVFDAVRVLTTAHERAQLRMCEGDRCGWVFLDRSRGRRRRWCSMADCGNREKARRHYTRLQKARPARPPRS
ncbi:MAG TPA: ABATE domain-containing protein [Vicinamibacterales bacterium]|nr:ABATE domain-containing protein [Vicinamibacterales bacterium]